MVPVMSCSTCFRSYRGAWCASTQAPRVNDVVRSPTELIRSLGWDFDLHPDGERVAVAPVVEGQVAPKQDKAVFVFNFLDELRRLAPAKP